MKTDRIDFISSYCDRWCERCGYTDRCSAYACQAAVAMCGDFAQGLELAVGIPQPVGREKPEPPAVAWLADFTNAEPTARELAEYQAADEARDARVDALPLGAVAWIYTMSSFEWLTEHYERLRERSDPIVAEALEIVMHDSAFIGAKVHRALDGLDRSSQGDGVEDDPVQNDWNGSAKIALISVERSETSWRAVAAATGDQSAAILADQLFEMRRLLMAEFPRAMSFIRPGFDEPWR